MVLFKEGQRLLSQIREDEYVFLLDLHGKEISSEDFARKMDELISSRTSNITFVIGGFEHIVANMFYIPMGMLAASNPDYVTKANELYNITSEQCSHLFSFGITKSFFFVTLGNILGGMLFVGVLFYSIHRDD